MVNVVEIPLDLTSIQLSVSLQQRLDSLLDRPNIGENLTIAEFPKTKTLVELAEFLLLLQLEIRHNRHDKMMISIRLQEVVFDAIVYWS
jgi:hypothetical protein